MESILKLYNYQIKYKLKWHFIAARTPSFRGIWEAEIKIVKYHFKRVIGNTKLDF